MLSPFYRWWNWSQRDSAVIIHRQFIPGQADSMGRFLLSPYYVACARRTSKTFNIHLKPWIGLCCHCQIKPRLAVLDALRLGEMKGFFFLFFKQSKTVPGKTCRVVFLVAFKQHRLHHDLSPCVAALSCSTSLPWLELISAWSSSSESSCPW